MLRYSDPELCPDCRATLPAAPRFCPDCRLPLSGPLAHELFRTLQHADRLLWRLRTEPVPDVPAPTSVPVPPRRPKETTFSRESRTGLRTASVPAILLGLGALCLLVAAVTFLAVAWSWLGVGGRTAVLVGLTAASAAASLVLERRRLRLAGESLTVVSLGLVALDVAGAINAGWLGTPDSAASIALVGGGVTVLAVAMLMRSRLVAPEVGVALGLMLVLTGLAVTTGQDRLVAFVAVVVLAAAAWLGSRAGAPVLCATAAPLAGAWWTWLLVAGLEGAISDLTVAGLWTGPNGLPLLGAAALLLGAAALPCAGRWTGACVSGAAALATLLVALPALDEGRTAVEGVLLVALVVWSGVAAATSLTVAAGPLILAGVPAFGFAAAGVLAAVERVWSVGDPYGASAGVRLDAALPGAGAPLLLVPLVAALLAAAWVATPLRRDWWLASGVLVLAATATLASYAVPLAAVLGVLVVAAFVAIRLGHQVTAIALTGATVAAALPSALLTAAACAVAVVVAVLLVRARDDLGGLLGGALLPAASAGLVWSVAEVAQVAVDLRAMPVMVVVGALAIARPRLELEVSAAVAGAIAAGASVAVAADQPTALALHLTVAGALVTLSSLLHQDRRYLAWPGGALLAAATWVRLADLGVEAPEPYTLPSAVVLVLVALHRLWRSPGTDTVVLLPGLVLGTVPSLLWVLADPVSLRAALLGAACLGLVLVGAHLRWSTPLAVGALVGATLVIRELAPYAREMPQWVLIGLAGTLLTVVGVTWERRVLELRRATAYLGRLR
ncbi:MAG TPA: hypothetical protein VFY58_01045 [Nocardioides sp.]|nr:hypothetical protein [Nocardioides sp.]